MREGYEKLLRWFSLSYASWLTIPRSLMQEMPDEWQSKMADLLNEYDEHFDFTTLDGLSTTVNIKKNGKFCKPPYGLLNYRHPDREFIDSLKRTYTTPPDTQQTSEEES